MNIKEIVEGMTAPQVAQVIKDNFNEVDKDKANKTDLNKSISDLASVVEANKTDLTKKIDNNKEDTDEKLSELGSKVNYLQTKDEFGDNIEASIYSEIGKKKKDFIINGYVYNDGTLRKLNGCNCTPIYYIYGSAEIHYRLQLNYDGHIVSFWDKNGVFLSDISIKTEDSNAVIRKESIDLTQPEYADAYYVAFSCWGYNSDFYAETSEEGLTKALSDLKSKTESENLELRDLILYNKGLAETTFYNEGGNVHFSLENKVYDNGKLKVVTGCKATTLIPIDNINIIKYYLYLDASGHYVSFFDKEKNFISEISKKNETAKDIKESIDLTQPEYANAFYVAFSGYMLNGVGSFYARFYNGRTNTEKIEDLDNKFNSVDNDVADVIETIGNSNSYVFNNGQYYSVTGKLVDLKFAYCTRKFSIKGNSEISYRLQMDASGYIVLFWSKYGELLSDISILGTEGGAIPQSGTIDLSQPEYADAYYVAFSCWAYSGNFYARSQEKGLVKDVNRNTENIISINNNLASLANDVGIDVSFSIVNCVYSYGSLKNVNQCVCTPKYSLTNTKSISYKLQLNYDGHIVSFWDKNGVFLSDISIKTEESNAVTKRGTIDLSQPEYADAYYVAFSCWNYSQNFYGKLETIKSTIKERLSILESGLKPFLFGKRFCALGDSITDGDGNSSYSWYDMLLSRYGSKDISLNFAETGQCLRTMADLCTAENMADIDICFVAGGTNQLSNYRLGTINDEATPDRWQASTAYKVGDKVLGGTLEKHGWTTPIYAYLYWYECVSEGTSGTTEDASGFNTEVDSLTTDGTVTWKCIGNPSWYSDMKGICRRVWGFNPKIQIIWIVPIKTKDDTNSNVPSNWAKSTKYQAIRNFCDAYSIRFIDLQKEFPLNEWTKDAIMADNLHPNKEGYKIIQDIVCSYIE